MNETSVKFKWTQYHNNSIEDIEPVADVAKNTICSHFGKDEIIFD